MQLPREKPLEAIHQRLKNNRVVALLGPRQCGKTTLAKQVKHRHYFDLENPRDAVRLAHPQITLEGLKGTIIIDEIQRQPELFPLLRHLVDEHPAQRYLLLGSAAPELVQKSSESLAGRIAFVELGGFSLAEVKQDWRRLWLRGGLPPSFLREPVSESVQWREDYVTTFLERDLPQQGLRLPAATLRRFWTMLAHYHGQVLHVAELGRSFGVSGDTVRRYLDVLSGTYMIQLLPPWHTNLGKRLVKHPKLYLRDSGLFHTLMAIEQEDDLLSHNKLGASWEGFVLNAFLDLATKLRSRFYFWATHAGAELDLFWQTRGKNWGLEVKWADAPTLTKSMQVALSDLKLERLWVVYPGTKAYALHERVRVLPIAKLAACVP